MSEISHSSVYLLWNINSPRNMTVTNSEGYIAQRAKAVSIMLCGTQLWSSKKTLSDALLAS